MITTQMQTTGYNERQIRLLEYLDNQVKTGKNFYIKVYRPGDRHVI